MSDWKRHVREKLAYDIRRDRMLVRWDAWDGTQQVTVTDWFLQASDLPRKRAEGIAMLRTGLKKQGIPLKTIKALPQ